MANDTDEIMDRVNEEYADKINLLEMEKIKQSIKIKQLENELYLLKTYVDAIVKELRHENLSLSRALMDVELAKVPNPDVLSQPSLLKQVPMKTSGSTTSKSVFTK